MREIIWRMRIEDEWTLCSLDTHCQITNRVEVKCSAYHGTASSFVFSGESSPYWRMHNLKMEAMTMLDLLDDIMKDFPGIVFRMEYSAEGAVFSILCDGCESFIGFTPQEGKNDEKILQKYIHTDDFDVFHTLHTTPREIGEPLRFLFRFNLGATTTWALEKSRVVAIDEAKGSYTYAGTIRNVTTKMELHSAVQKCEAKTNFLAAMSHEIRTPLNAITGVLYMLGQTKLSSRQEQCLSYLKTASVTLMETINDVLDFSKIEAGGMTTSSKRFNIKAVLTDVQTIFVPQVLEKKIPLIIQLAENVPQCLLGDAYHIRQMLVNFVGNAFKFTSSGHIDLDCEVESREKDEVVLKFTVTDTGIGMDSAVLEHIFCPFAQAHSNVPKRQKGTGLGLSIVKSLAEQLGGGVSVTSTKGKGSTFVFTCKVKVLESALEENLAKTVSVPLFEEYKVLVVDDNAINREIASFLLKDAGLRVTEAENGLDAVQILNNSKDCPYSLVLMDIEMPVLNGIQATQKIRSLQDFGGIPIIAMTAHSFGAEVDKCLAAGMSWHISKPLDVQEFYSVVSQFLPRLHG